MPAPVLSLDHVTVDVQRRCVAGRRLGMLRVLEDCSLHVAAGEALTLVGPSGSGKSTLLDLFAGFAQPIAGSVTVGGRPVTGPGPERGFVQPSYGLFPWRSAHANVTFSLGAPDRVRRGAAALELVGLAESADRLVGTLSPAQKQRVALAKALVHEPGVLLLDDPFAELDPAERRLLQDDLMAIHRVTGVTLVLATGSLEEADRIGSRIAVLSPRPGRVQEFVEPVAVPQAA